VPSTGAWTEVLNTDAEDFGGSGVLNGGTLTAEDEGIDGQPATLTVTLPPLGAAYFKPAESSVLTSAAAAKAKVTEAESVFAGPTDAETRAAETRKGLPGPELLTRRVLHRGLLHQRTGRGRRLCPAGPSPEYRRAAHRNAHVSLGGPLV
jgi:hypothetical protein